MAGIGTHKELMKNCEVYQSDCKISVIRGGIGMRDRQRRRGPMGGHGRGMMSDEKAKDFKGSMKKLLLYLSAYKFRFLLLSLQ